MSDVKSGSRPVTDNWKALPFGRILLLLSALVAIVAVGLSILRNRPTPSETTPASTAATPVGDVPSVIAALEKKLQKDPKNAEGWHMLGWSYYSTGRYADAVVAYQKATLLAPGKSEYWSALGEVLVLNGPGGVVAEAEAAFRKALAIDPKDFRARYFIGVKKDQAGDHKAALDDWIALLKDAPADAPWAESVRELIGKVSVANKIDIAGKLPAPSRSELPSSPVPHDGIAVATGAIPGPTPDQLRSASSLPPSAQRAMVKDMVDRLAGRLAANPRDGDGWIRLMRAHMVQNDPAAATTALTKAKAAFADDKAEQTRLTDAARALGVPGA